ncbi:alpha/beta hydrolase [Wangella sp. NEAU-J3]|nr:alpha/beta hydrolase [Jidongwangia harbinensis]
MLFVHGGGITTAPYRRFAHRLAATFTVHLYNRRGRADAAPHGAGHTVDTDIADLAAVQHHTGARYVAAHSHGCFVTLRAARQLAFDRIALYDPTVNLGGFFPTDWFAEFEAAVRAGHRSRALALMGRGVRAGGPLSALPLSLQTAVAHAFQWTPVGRTMGELLPTVVIECRESLTHDEPAAAYAGITAEVLLVTGGWCPPYYRTINNDLAAALPRAASIVVPGSRHDAIAIARPALCAPFAEFFADGLSSPRRTRSLPGPA